MEWYVTFRGDISTKKPVLWGQENGKVRLWKWVEAKLSKACLIIVEQQRASCMWCLCPQTPHFPPYSREQGNCRGEQIGPHMPREGQCVPFLWGWIIVLQYPLSIFLFSNQIPRALAGHVASHWGPTLFWFSLELGITWISSNKFCQVLTLCRTLFHILKHTESPEIAIFILPAYVSPFPSLFSFFPLSPSLFISFPLLLLQGIKGYYLKGQHEQTEWLSH